MDECKPLMTGMVPTSSIDVDAPFALAFRDRGMGWAESVISFGAVAAITTALLSSLMGKTKYHSRQYGHSTQYNPR